MRILFKKISDTIISNYDYIPLGGTSNGTKEGCEKEGRQEEDCSQKEEVKHLESWMGGDIHIFRIASPTAKVQIFASNFGVGCKT